MRRTNRFIIGLAAMFAGILPVTAAENPAIDPAAMAALQKMGTYLRTLTAFQVEAVTTDEDVLDDGAKIQYSGTTSLLAKMPGKLRVEVTDDRHERLYLFDGRNFTLFAERLGYYATVPAPATIVQLADSLDAKYDFSVPLEDLFRWGTAAVPVTDIKAALVVGPSVVDGVTCEHYAFRQDDVDWQVWIQLGDYPLPRKLVITTKTDEARPQHTAVFTWNLAPSYNDAAFTFEPTAGALRVALPGAAASPAQGK